jgi:hypothetical protein
MMLRRAFLDISGYGSQLGNLFPVDLHLSWPVPRGIQEQDFLDSCDFCHCLIPVILVV